MDAKVSSKTKTKTMPVQNLFRYISFKKLVLKSFLDTFLQSRSLSVVRTDHSEMGPLAPSDPKLDSNQVILVRVPFQMKFSIHIRRMDFLALLFSKKPKHQGNFKDCNKKPG